MEEYLAVYSHTQMKANQMLGKLIQVRKATLMCFVLLLSIFITY